jgi:signal transduction histidine kinase
VRDELSQVVAALRRAEQESRLLRTIAHALSETDDVAAALDVVLRGVCEQTGWIVGQAWLVSPDGTSLTCCPAWYSAAAGVEPFRAASQQVRFAPGEGLPGRAWATRQPAWSRDISLDSLLPRGPIGREVGLKAGLAIPVRAGSQVVGVLEFFQFDQREEDERLVAVVSAVAAHVGQLIRRKQAEEARRQVDLERAALLAVEREHVRHLRQLAALKADLTTLIAHELGSPLAAMRTLVDMLAAGQLPGDEQARTIGTLRSELRLLTALVADVQATASLEQDDFAVRIRRVPVADLLTEAAEFARALPGGHDVITTSRAAGQVLADPERISQVLRNLLTNAAKYTPPGTPIELRATSCGEHVRLEVADRGPGVAPEDRARIFEKFWRGHQQADVAGLGLGLYLARRLCQAHGTDLKVEAAPGTGAIFAFALRVAL